MPRRGKTDANQGEICQALYAVGAFPIQLQSVGRGIPDLAVWFRGETHWLEVKVSWAEARRKSKTIQEQSSIRDIARSRGVHILVVTTPEEALRAIGATDAEG